MFADLSPMLEFLGWVSALQAAPAELRMRNSPMWGSPHNGPQLKGEVMASSWLHVLFSGATERHIRHAMRCLVRPAFRFGYGSPLMRLKNLSTTHFFMQNTDILRHLLIKRVTTQRLENGPDAGADLWRQMAAQLILIIGSGGFDSLYARSVYLGRATYPWLGAGSGLSETNHRFSDLETSFQTQSPTLARDANCLLLITFTDILASMIGEHLTIRILDSAWATGAQDTPDKEVNNG